MSKVISGTNAADTIKVWESGVTVQAGSGNDTVHLKKGTGSTVHVEAGNDTIYVYAGTHTVYGGTGDDVMVTWANAGNGSRFEGGAGDDSFKIKGGNNHTIVMGDGTLNTVNLDKGSGHKITGGNTGVDRLFICSDAVTNVEADLKNGENRATMWGGVTNTITGGKDMDIFNVKGGSQNKLYGGAGKDYLIIHEGKQNHVYGGAGDDRLTVWHKSGDKNYLYGEDGNDIIEINGGNEHEIDGGDGYNTVKLKGGNKHTYIGGSGKDIVYISGGNEHTVNAGDGTNKITVYSGTGHTITGGKDSDTVDLQGGNGATVNTGIGKNYINITGGDGHKVYGGESVDNVKVYGGDGHQIYGGAGWDFVLLDEGVGDDILVDGGEGTDFIVVKGGKNHTLYSGDGEDYIDIYGGDYLTIFGGEGRDEFLVRGYLDQKQLIVHGDGGNDRIALTGSNGNNYLYGDDGDDGLQGGSGNDRLFGGIGNDSLDGADGKDVLYGGEGKDEFYFTRGKRFDTVVKDYTENEDGLNFTGISQILNTEKKGSGIVFTISGSEERNTVTLENARNMAIKIRDRRTVITASDQLLRIEEGGKPLDAEKFLSTIVTVDGRKASASIDIKGNAQNNILYASQFGGTVQGGAGNDQLYGGAGNDIFQYQSGHDTIFDYEAGKDIIKLDSVSLKNSEISGSDVLLTLSNDGTILIKNMAGHSVDYSDASGNVHSVTPSVTQQSVIKSFMRSLWDSGIVVASDALNAAVEYASHGLFPTWDSLVDRFVSDVRNYGGTASDGNGYKAYYSDNDEIIKMPESTTDVFLKTYCGIDLTNDDTGSITGADCGGSVVKTSESIMPPESGTLANAQYPTSDKVIGKLTIKWPDKETLSATQQMIIAGLDAYWADAALNLIQDSYGFIYPKDGDVNFTMKVQFYTNAQSNVLASASATSLKINMFYWDEMDSNNINGKSPGTGFYFDRVMAHELTHSVMCASLYNYDNIVVKEDGTWVREGHALWNSLNQGYSCVNEGLAELTHGIDDDRFYDICQLAQAANADKLQNALTDSSNYYRYAGGYMLFRYLAKQSAENYFSMDSSASADMAANSFTNPNDSFTSDLWSEPTAQVADTDGELASSILSISNAMLTPLDNRNGNMLGSDSPVSGLFSDKKNGLNFVG